MINTIEDVKRHLVRGDLWGVKTEARVVEKMARVFDPHCEKMPIPSGFNQGGATWEKSRSKI